MISVGLRHIEHVFKDHQELERHMSEHGYSKQDVDWYEENPQCAQPWGVHCSRLDLRGGEEPCEVCKFSETDSHQGGPGND